MVQSYHYISFGSMYRCGIYERERERLKWILLNAKNGKSVWRFKVSTNRMLCSNSVWYLNYDWLLFIHAIYEYNIMWNGFEIYSKVVNDIVHCPLFHMQLRWNSNFMKLNMCFVASWMAFEYRWTMEYRYGWLNSQQIQTILLRWTRILQPKKYHFTTFLMCIVIE